MGFKRTRKLFFFFFNVAVNGILTKLSLQYLKNKKQPKPIIPGNVLLFFFFLGQRAQIVQLLSGLLKMLQELSHVHSLAELPLGAKEGCWERNIKTCSF